MTGIKSEGRRKCDLQEAREEEKQRGQRAETDGDAASVRVAEQAGGDRIRAEFG